MLKIEQWKKDDPDIFRPFVAHKNPTQPEVQKNGEGNGETENAGNYKQQLLWYIRQTGRSSYWHAMVRCYIQDYEV